MTDLSLLQRICAYVPACFLYICIMSCILALPIAELCIALIYKNEIICESEIGIDIVTWLVIKSIVTISTVLVISCFFMIGKDSPVFRLVYLIKIIIYIFNFSWLIVGSLIFWRDCYDLQPESVNTFMWISLILGYVNLLSYVNGNK